jgi:hypothetical protein
LRQREQRSTGVRHYPLMLREDVDSARRRMGRHEVCSGFCHLDGYRDHTGGGTMTKTITGAWVLLSLAALASGCMVGAADNGESASAEPTDTATQDLSVGAAFFDPFACTQSATQCNGMHCCAFGEAMSGAHFGTNTFQCRAITGADESTCFVDKTTTRRVEGIALKACPPGFYMKGHHAGLNQSTCCAYASTNQSTNVFLDGHGEAPAQATDQWLNSPSPFAGVCQPGSMHVCPGSSVMEGVQISANFFACGS